MAALTYFAVPGWATTVVQQTADDGAHGWEETWRIGLSRGVSAEPMSVDSMLVIASLDRNLHAVVPGADPRVAWKKNMKGGFEAAPIALGDLLILAETGAQGRLVAMLRDTRAEAWSIRLGDLVARPFVDGERIYAVATSGRVAGVTARGVEQWRIELESRVVSSPLVLGDALVLAATDGTLFALDPATGVVRERVDPGTGPIWGDAVVLEPPDGEPLAIYATLSGQLFAVTSDLEVVARRSFPSRFFVGPRLDGSILYLSGHEGMIWAYEWGGAELRWQRELPGVLRSRPAVHARGVAVGDLGGTLYILDRETGELRWHTRLDGAITASPLSEGSTVYVATEQGSLYAFRPTTSASR
jgi:outer membrane protein assembly factor BamB